MSTVKERFLRYIQLDTASNAESDTCPSTEGQWVLARLLVEELHQIGVADARVDEHCYVYASLPATAENLPAIGLIAHMDTVDGVPCQPMRARSVPYTGGAIVLNEETGETLDPACFPQLAEYQGQELIVTDGRTILGADDKAGVAEIMTLCERLIENPGKPHGKICIGFTPDEEIGRGADLFDVKGFGADFAYTIDGGGLGELEFENFNAAGARVLLHGVNIHPGSSKNKMRSALLLAMRFHGMLPPAEAPAHTEGYEGFYHLCDLRGNEELAEMRYIVRDHDPILFEKRKATLRAIAAYLNAEYGEEVVTLELKDSYRNMKEMILPHMHIIERAEAAMRTLGITPRRIPIRGGTDGARLSYMGLPCPNLCCGGENAHGRHEFVSVDSMERVVDLLEAVVVG
ncbi:MAG: peptidase T [Oscillospiraceae bacterium]|jgi:tripeptide aminopeptidase|nr:peptidase T [Oscillospiraceae bacterium]